MQPHPEWADVSGVQIANKSGNLTAVHLLAYNFAGTVSAP